MNTNVPINSIHQVRLGAPYYQHNSLARSGGGALHRYLDTDFLPRYLQDLQNQQLASLNNTEWQTQDRFSRHDQSLVLRLPVHKTFYLFSCEVNCARLGDPALDEKRITSAGFVIRRQRDDSEDSWMIENNRPLGWRHSATGLNDPDLDRPMCRDRSLHTRSNVPSYSGEKTHPLHVASQRDNEGKRHTVLYGYVPLGGEYYPVRNHGESPFEQDSEDTFKQAAGKHLPWPFGYRDGLNPAWQNGHRRQVYNGKPSQAFFKLLSLFAYRYHLGETQDSLTGEANQGLQALCENIFFYSVNEASEVQMLAHFSDATRELYQGYQRYSLWQWLQGHFDHDNDNNSSSDKPYVNPLVNWLATQEKNLDDAEDSGENYELERLPNQHGTGSTSYSLYISESDALQLRNQLDQRVMANATQLAEALPAAKFQQNPRDRYQIVPFVRAKDDHGKEFIYWGDTSSRSELFRVAAPFDPFASRPSLIQMPSLQDLRSGMARGVSMVTPPDTFNLLNALKFKKGVTKDVVPEEEPEGIGIQWICSFSLPIVTFVAMLLLMIIINLLNFFFFWLPWIRICLPFPRRK